MTEPNTLDEQITYGVDMGATNGDKTALTIRKGSKAYTYTGEEAKMILALFTEHSKEVDRLARIDELKAVVVDFDERKLLTTGDTVTQLITHGERIAQLSKRNKGEDNE